jgi:hypothetical protein
MVSEISSSFGTCGTISRQGFEAEVQIRGNGGRVLGHDECMLDTCKTLIALPFPR